MGEAAALRVGRVDLDARRIRIASTLYEVGGVQHEGPLYEAMTLVTRGVDVSVDRIAKL